MGTAVMNGLSHATVGMFRIPALTVGALGLVLTGELARRVFVQIATTNQYTEKASSWIYEHSPKMVQDLVSTINKATWMDIARSAVVCFVAHIAGMEALSALFGRPHPYYNVFMKATTFISINDAAGYHHPLVQYAIDAFKARTA
jgi:hypothetical protein